MCASEEVLLPQNPTQRTTRSFFFKAKLMLREVFNYNIVIQPQLLQSLLKGTLALLGVSGSVRMFSG